MESSIDSATLFSENLASILDDGDFIQFLNNEPFTTYSPETVQAQLESPELFFDPPVNGTINVPNSSPSTIADVFIKSERPEELSSSLVEMNSANSQFTFGAVIPQDGYDNGTPDSDIKISKRASQNRVASRNYRKRKKQYVEDLEEQLRQMVVENQKLRREQYFSQVAISSLSEENLKMIHAQPLKKLSCKRDPVEETGVLKQLETQLSTGASNEELFGTLSQISGICSRAIQEAMSDLKEFITASFLIQFCFTSPEEEEEEEPVTEITEFFKKEALPRMGFSPQQTQRIGSTYPTYKQQLSQLKSTRKQLSEDLRKYLVQRHFLRMKQAETLPPGYGNILSAVDSVIGKHMHHYNDPNTRESKRPFLATADKTLFLEDQFKVDSLTIPTIETLINQTMDHLRQNLLDEQALYMYYFREVSGVLSIPQQAMFVLFMRKRSISCSHTIKILWTLFAPEATQITFPRNSPLLVK